MGETPREISRILIDAEAIQQRVRELGSQIEHDYAGKSPLLVCVLRGAAVFYSDLIREVHLALQVDFIAVSSYGSSTKTSGQVRLIKDLEASIEGLDVILVEDIVDSGLTLAYLLENLRSRRPASLRVCALLSKPSRREVEIEVDYIGFEIPNEFAVGYGLDYNQCYRNLPYIGVLDPSAIG